MSSETASPPWQDPEPQAEQKTGMHIVESTLKYTLLEETLIAALKAGYRSEKHNWHHPTLHTYTAGYEFARLRSIHQEVRVPHAAISAAHTERSHSAVQCNTKLGPGRQNTTVRYAQWYRFSHASHCMVFEVPSMRFPSRLSEYLGWEGLRSASSRITLRTKTCNLPLMSSSLDGTVLHKQALIILFVRFGNKSYLRNTEKWHERAKRDNVGQGLEGGRRVGERHVRKAF